MARLENKYPATGIKVEEYGISELCECCIKGKITRLPFPKESSNSIESIFYFIHTNVCGLMETHTPTKNRYILTLIDNYSRFLIIRLMKNKREATPLIKEFIEYAKTQFGKTPGVIRSDHI